MNLEELLIQKNINFKKDEPLSAHTYYKIGGPAKWFIQPQNKEELVTLYLAIKDLDIPIYILGGGANVLFSDSGYDGIIINLSKTKNISLSDNTITAEAGIDLQTFVDFSIDNELGGYAELSGIPGSLGGALKMNAGAFGVELYDYITTLQIINITGEIKTINKNKINAGYRNAGLAPGTIALAASFELFKKSKEDLLKIKNEIIAKRHNKQPWDIPSCGSVFKKAKFIKLDSNYPIQIEITDDFKKWNGVPAGVLIEKVGLKGKVIGGAQISEKHANFIINLGTATAQDVLALINLARKEVLAKTGYIIEPEVQLIGLELETLG